MSSSSFSDSKVRRPIPSEPGMLARREATVRAGTKQHDMGEDLLALGLAMANLGDVDVQSVAGAIGTGTHGTGRALANLSSLVTGMRLVTASGEILDPRDGSDLLPAARVSLGTLGVVSAVTLRLEPAYRLHERVWREPHAVCLDRLDERITGNVRYEFFWFPQSDEMECKTLNPTDRPVDADTPAGLVLGTPAAAAGTVREPVERERVGWSARIIPSIRERKFNEMEYAVPAAAGPDCFRRVRERMQRRHPEVAWPVEYRTLAADDAWLSPAHGRDTVTISIHQDARLPYLNFFTDIEAIFLEHGGRPHWGKVHTRTAADLRGCYPRWDGFAAVRARLDPDGRFLNEHLQALFLPA
jgi:FAD/FMN-containing dehydrogenase